MAAEDDEELAILRELDMIANRSYKNTCALNAINVAKKE